jgi:hypothetical protein
MCKAWCARSPKRGKIGRSSPRSVAELYTSQALWEAGAHNHRLFQRS